MTPDILLHILARFLHVGSIVILLGGVVFARQVLTPALNGLPEEQRIAAFAFSRSQVQTALWVLMVVILVTGFYNFLTYAGPKHTPLYHSFFGVKMLLVIHFFSTAIPWSTSGNLAKNGRRLLSLSISGFIIVLISAYLRSLSQRGL